MLTLVRALRRLGGTGATLLALTATSVLLAMCGALLAAGVDGQHPPQRYADAPIVLGGTSSAVVHGSTKDKTVDLPGPQPVSPETVDLARRHLPAGAQLVTEVTARVGLGFGGQWTPVAAHGWSATRLGPLRLVAGSAPTGPGQVVVDDSFGWAPGTIVQLLTSERPWTVTGRVALPDREQPRDPAIYLTDTAAAELAQRPAVTAVGVLPGQNGFDTETVADDLRSALATAPVRVETGDGRGQIEFPDLSSARNNLRSLSGSLVAIVVLVALVIIGSTCALTLSRRRADLATLSALGATPRQLTRLTTAELAAAGLAGGLFGLAPAAVLLPGFAGMLRLAGLLPSDLDLALGLVPAIAAVLLTTAIATVIGWAAGHRAAAVSPATAMRTAENQDSPTPGWQRVLGGVLLVVGTGASLLPLFVDGVVGIAVAGGGGLLLVAGLAVLTRPLASFVFRSAARRLLASRTPHRWLAGAGMAGQTTRLAAAVAPMLLMVGLSLVQVVLPASMTAAAQRQAAAGLGVASAVTGPGYGLPSTGPGVPVARQRVVGVTTVLGGPEPFTYTATATRGPAAPALDLALRPGARWDPTTPLGPGQAVLGAMTAATLGVSVGDKAEFVLADGTTVHPVVAGISERGLGLGDVFLDYATLVRHRPTNAPAGQSADLLLVSDPVPFGTTVAAADAFGAGRSAMNTSIAASIVPLLALFGYIALSVANSLVLSVTSRTSTFRMLRRTGAGRRQLARSLVVEGIAVVATAIVLGTAGAVLPMVTIASRLTGTPWPAVPPVLYLAVVAAVAVLGMTSVLLPGRLVLRQDSLT